MDWRKGIVFFVLISALLIPREAVYPASSREITVSAAISLKDSFEEIGRAFVAGHRGVKVSFNFGASGDLKRQIEGGAPVDVFASAGFQEMNELAQKGIVINSSVVAFVRNAVILIEPAGSKLVLASFSDLKRGEVKKIAIVNPKTSPAGRYAQQVLTYFQLWDTIRDKLVFGESVRQVLDYAARGEVDAGMVYATDTWAVSDKVRVILQAPEESHEPIIYSIGVVKGTKNKLLAEEFVAFVASREAWQIFEKYGFKPLAK
jgi:molybdate transport system substrate-binding protein